MCAVCYHTAAAMSGVCDKHIIDDVLLSCKIIDEVK